MTQLGQADRPCQTRTPHAGSTKRHGSPRPAVLAIWAAALLGLAGLLGGCAPSNRVLELRKSLTQRDQEIAAIKSSLADEQATVRQQRQQIARLQNLGPKRLDEIFHVARIELGRYTGGYQVAGQGGDAGIKVYLTPIDQHGSALKAAGSVTIQLFELGRPPGQNLYEQFRYPVQEAAKHWFSGFLTYHYSFQCPWKKGQPPTDSDITVRTTFVDYLTGKTFTAQKEVHVTLPTTQPAK